MKETYYFQHDYEPTSDPKMTAFLGKFGATGYGIYWRIVEMLHSDKRHQLPKKVYIYEAIAQQMNVSSDEIKKMIEYAIETCELFCEDEEFFWSRRVNNNIEKRNEIKRKRSIAGKASAQKRTNVEQKPTKEKKGKESKVKEINISFDEFWNLYDKKVGDKEKIEKKWNSLTDKEREKTIEHVEEYKVAQPDKQYRKNPQTYLNNKGWEDEVIKPRGKYDFPGRSDESVDLDA